MFRIESAGVSDRGRRRCDNQDRYLVGSRWFAVADGVGGHAGGDVAAQLALDVLHCLERKPSRSWDLVHAVKVANAEINLVGRERPALRNLATTITVMEVVPLRVGFEVHAVSVGDSRLYLLRQGRLTQLTTDDAIPAAVCVEGGRQRRVLTRALGLEPDIDVSLAVYFAIEDDRLILCTDGVTDELPDDAICELGSGFGSARATVEQLVWAAVAAGGRDNATAVVVDLLGGDGPPDRCARTGPRCAA